MSGDNPKRECGMTFKRHSAYEARKTRTRNQTAKLDRRRARQERLAQLKAKMAK